MSVEETTTIVTRMASAQTHTELILAIVQLVIAAMDDSVQVFKSFCVLKLISTFFSFSCTFTKCIDKDVAYIPISSPFLLAMDG